MATPFSSLKSWLLECPDVVHHGPDVICFRDLGFIRRHILPALVGFIEDRSVCLALEAGFGEVAAFGIQLGCFRAITFSFCAMAGFAMLGVQGLSLGHGCSIIF